MFHIILCVFKVLFRNGETLIEIIQEIITEVKGQTVLKADLDDFKAQTILDEKGDQK